MTNGDMKLNPQRVSYQVNGGVQLVGDAWGASDAAPVLLLHGGGQTRHAWGGTAGGGGGWPARRWARGRGQGTLGLRPESSTSSSSATPTLTSPANTSL